MLYLHALDCRDLSLFYLFFAFFSKQTIKIDFCIVFLIFFSSYLIVMENLLLLIHIGSWRDLFLIYLACFFFIFYDLMNCCHILKTYINAIFWIYCDCFAHWQYNLSIWSKRNLTSFSDSPWPIWTGSYWKSSSIISSVSLPIIISVLSLLECIRRIPLLTIGDMKSIFIVRWNFHEPNYLRSSAI